MTTRSLKLAKDLTLPLDAVSRTFGILAVRGAGKSNTAAVMAEEMFAAHLPFCVVDPVGSWYGLRSSADGTAPGLPIPIFGGKHGDVPLERGAGELIADLIVEKRLTCVLDLSRFESEGAKKTFLLAFAQRLYLKNENPLHLFLEEADDYIPQKPMRDEAQLLRAWENIVRRGRARGLGMTIITQRSAAVAKMVLTQVETLFAMRTTGPQDIAAIEAWIKYHQADKEILSTLAGLADGEAWVWSPHFLKTMSRHQIRRRETFDSGATPKNIRAADTRPPATLADIDLSALQERMAATIEKAKQDDPRELRKELARVKQALSMATGAQQSLISQKTIEKSILTDADRALLKAVSQEFHEFVEAISDRADVVLNSIAERAKAEIDKASSDWAASIDKRRGLFLDRLEQTRVQKILGKLETVKTCQNYSEPITTARKPLTPRQFGAQFEAAGRTAPATSQRPARQVSPSSNGNVSGAERRILNALAELEALGVRQAERVQVAFFAGYTHLNSKGLVNALGALRTAGLIDYPTPGLVVLTPEGRQEAGPVDAPRSPEEIRTRVVQMLGGASARLLDPLIKAYPRAMTREDLAAAANYGHLNSKGFVNALGRLRSLGFIDYPDRGHVAAQPVLFLET